MKTVKNKILINTNDFNSLKETLKDLAIISIKPKQIESAALSDLLKKPKFKKLSTEYEFPFVYVDADKLPNSRDLVTLTNVPSIALFKGNENVAQDYGNKIEVIKKVLESI